MNIRPLHALALLVGRLLVGGIYMLSSMLNFAGMNGSIGYAASKGVPAPALFVPLASLIVLAAGISFVIGFKPHIGVLAVWVFLVPVTLSMHNFWALEGTQAFMEFLSFKNNLGLLGGALMFLAIPQPWPWSVDQWLAARKESRRTIPVPAAG